MPEEWVSLQGAPCPWVWLGSVPGPPARLPKPGEPPGVCWGLPGGPLRLLPGLLPELQGGGPVTPHHPQPPWRLEALLGVQEDLV